ncbi:MAG: EamA family transporter [Proteobacteria bacterium]|nr:EamA family transporter [Pseudomonadota bacterium]
MPGGLISIHGSILLFGTAGLFGKFLNFDAVLIVQGRTLIAFVALVLVHRLMQVPLLLKDRQHWIWMGMTGCILAVHWIGFFRSIQISSVAIGLLSFSSYPLFTIFLEPMFFPERLKRRNIIAVTAVMAGLVLIATSGSSAPKELTQEEVLQGLSWGIFASFSFAVLTLLNRKHVQHHHPLTVACWQNGIAAMLLLPLSLQHEWQFSPEEIGLLLLLGLLCTATGHVLLINGLRQVSVQLTSLLHAGLEPVYGILFALILLSEIPTLQTLVGGVMIVGVSILMSIKHGTN